jgi:hypothetical protein
MMQHLSDTFPNRWICRPSTIKWPPISHLTPLDVGIAYKQYGEVKDCANVTDEIKRNLLGCIDAQDQVQTQVQRDICAPYIA